MSVKIIRRLVVDAMQAVGETRYMDAMDFLEDADRQLLDLIEAADTHGPTVFDLE